jgi:amidase
MEFVLGWLGLRYQTNFLPLIGVSSLRFATFFGFRGGAVRRFVLVVALLISCGPVWAQAPASGGASSGAGGPLTGRWIVSADYLGTPVDLTLNLQQDGDKLTGDFDGDKLEGTVKGSALHVVAKDSEGGTEELTAKIDGDTMAAGQAIFTDAMSPSHPLTLPFTAIKAVSHGGGTPQRHEFTPTVFYRRFSAATKPVLTIAPGDTIHTTTVDAGGADEKGVVRSLGGNPQTGPFYVEGAYPGDTLVVHIVKLRLNRDWAVSDDDLVQRATDSGLAIKMKDAGKSIRWHLDTQKGVATLEKPGEHLAHYSIPLKPMLGCVAVATGPASAAPGTGDSGNYGGNMDFNEVVEGSTVYLPVNITGALLYFGDGHAAQGDGELTGNALETSMDVEVKVDVISGKGVPGPRVETATHWIAMGLAGSIDEAFKGATSNMASWLTDEYKLTAPEIAEVLGTAAEFKVSEVADRNAGVVLKINKSLLEPLKTTSK